MFRTPRRGAVALFLVIPAVLASRPPAAHAQPISPPVVNPANGSVYYLLSQTDWTTSEMEAVKLGGHLATIRNSDDQAFVFGTFSNYGGVQRLLWIGLTDGASEGTFRWVDGSPVTYTNWASGEPNNAGANENFVAMYYPGFNQPGKWNDWGHRSSDPIGVRFNGVAELRSDAPRPTVLCITDAAWKVITPVGNSQGQPLATVGQAWETANPGWNSALGYEDSAWGTAAPIGSNTIWASGADANNAPAYFRRTFEYDPSMGAVTLLATFDDNGIVYVNGQAVITDPTGGASGHGPVDVTAHLVAGTNLIAAKVQDVSGPQSFSALLFHHRSSSVSGTPPSATVGVPYDFQFAASGFTDPQFAVTAGSLPPGLTLSAAGRLSGTPTAAGPYLAVTVTVTDGSLPAGQTVQTTFDVTVYEAPAITGGLPPGVLTVGVPYSFQFAATGSPAPTFAVTAGTLPVGLTLTPAGLLSGTPTAAGGPFGVTVSADNGVGSPASAAFSLTVSPALSAPAITGGLPPGVLTVGAPYSFQFAATGYPAPTFAVTAGSLQAGLTLSPAGLLSGTPTAAGGPFAVTVSADNGVGSPASVTFLLTISPAPSAPAITGGTPPGDLTVGVPYSFQFSATGTPAPSFSVAAGTLPAGLTLTPAGLLSGIPTAAGTFAVAVAAGNGVAPAAAVAFTLTVAPAPVPLLRLFLPAAGSHLFTTDANEAAVLAGFGWVGEGVAGYLYPSPTSRGGVATVPLVRLLNPVTGDHLLTSEPAEAAYLSALGLYVEEGTVGHVLPAPVPGMPLIAFERFVTPSYAPVVLHTFATDPVEREYLLEAGWVLEGAMGLILPPG
jgi:hypothetical protein